MSNIISPRDLQQLLADGWPGVILHLLPEEHYRQHHLPGAKLACVYETSFLSQVGAAGAGAETPLVLSGAGPRPFATEAAEEKLAVAGFTNVSVLEGGLDAWIAAGFPIEGEPASPPKPSDYDGRYVLNTTDSVIRWTGRNLFNHHEGTVRLSGGQAVIANGEVSNAAFTIDMHSIACADLADQGLNAMLLAHLADADFFLTSRFPSAEFTLKQAREIHGALPGTPNYVFTGDFQLRGITQEIRFEVTVAPNGADRISAQAQFEIDRTRWGVLYGSSKFYDFLGKHVVNDAVHLHLKIHLDRA